MHDFPNGTPFYSGEMSRSVVLLLSQLRRCLFRISIFSLFSCFFLVYRFELEFPILCLWMISHSEFTRWDTALAHHQVRLSVCYISYWKWIHKNFALYGRRIADCLMLRWGLWRYKGGKESHQCRTDFGCCALRVSRRSFFALRGAFALDLPKSERGWGRGTEKEPKNMINLKKIQEFDSNEIKSFSRQWI